MNTAHAKSLRRVLTVAIGVALLAGAARVEAAWTLTLVNETGQTITFYQVNESPPPSRLPAGTIPDDGTFNIDPDGFNTVFAWPGGISTTGSAPNGFFIGLALSDSPPLIQYKRFHYKVTPGEAGSDPTLQPILLDQQIVEVVEGEVLIIVDTTFNATIGPPVYIGACCALSECTNVAVASACSGGNLLMSASCTPELCTSASQSIGPGGGTIETPDGSVGVEFPPDCLSGSTAITIEEADYPSGLYDIQLTGAPGADFDVHLAYSFEPTDLDFCPEAKLCMSFDRTVLGLDPTDCNDMRFFHHDRICGFDPDADCVTDSDCPPGVLCSDSYHTDPVTCECPASSSVGKCCGNIKHFSDYILVSPMEERPPCSRWCRCCCRRGCTSACGRGIVPCLSMMFLVLGFAKARRTWVVGRCRFGG